MNSGLVNHTIKFNSAILDLIKAKHHESALMLIYAFIDRMAWISVEGDATGADFKAWVNQYLLPQNNFLCSADDLWAARCGLLHTGAVEARDTKSGKAKKVLYCGGGVVVKLDSIPVDEVFVDVGMLHTGLIAAIPAFEVQLQNNAEQLAIANQKLGSIIAKFKVV